MKTSRLYMVLLVFTILLAISILFIACEAENPGEPPINEMPDTHISEATAGNVTTIIFYVTDDEVTTWKFAYKWDSDIDWSFTNYNVAGVDTAVFYDIFSDQNEVKTFYVKAIDHQGNEDPYPAEISLSPNNTLPTTSIIAGPGFGDITGEDVTFTFTGSDIEEGGSVVAFQYTMDDLNNWQEIPVTNPSASFSGLSEGAHTFYVRAVDNLGGADASPEQVAFIVRVGFFAPIIENLSPVSNGSGWPANVLLEFKWSASVEHYFGILHDTPFSFAFNDSINLDYNPSTPLASGWNSNNSTNYVPIAGLHTFYLKVRDSAGGVSLMTIEFEATAPFGLHGILIVCGVQASKHGSLLVDKINTGAYWGSLPVSFWDIFGDMYNPQPEFTLPSNAGYVGGGSGIMNPANIGPYSTIVWLCDNNNGDLEIWNNSPILQYLNAGGNIILATKDAESFFSAELKNYINIDFNTNPTFSVYTINEYKSLIPAMIDVGPPFDLTMDSTSLFFTTGFKGGNNIINSDITNWTGNTSFSKDPFTTLLFAHRDSSYSSNYTVPYVGGLGIWSHPNYVFNDLTSIIQFPIIPSAGNFILINGRPYSFDSQACRQNFEFMLRNMCGEQ